MQQNSHVAHVWLPNAPLRLSSFFPYDIALSLKFIDFLFSIAFPYFRKKLLMWKHTLIVTLLHVLPDGKEHVWSEHKLALLCCPYHQEISLSFPCCSWDEMGQYDVPAMIDYVLNKTGHADLFYVGHSMGKQCVCACACVLEGWTSSVTRSQFSLDCLYLVNYIVERHFWGVTSALPEFDRKLCDGKY